MFPVRPISVQILQKPKQMVADEEYMVTCQVTGSRPRATVSWIRDNRKFRRGKVTVTNPPRKISQNWIHLQTSTKHFF